MSYPNTTLFIPTKLLGDTDVTGSGAVIDLNASISGQPVNAYDLPAPRSIVLTNKSAEDWVEVAFYSAGSTVTPSYGDAFPIPPGTQIGVTLPGPEKTVIGAVADSGKTVALNVVAGHGV